MAGDAVFESLRAALGRKKFQKPSTPPEPRLEIRNWTAEERLGRFRETFAARGGTLHVVRSAAEARARVEELLAGRGAVASRAPGLAEYGILDLAGVQSGFPDAELLRNAGQTTRIGISSCHCLLAESGTLVFRFSAEEPRSVALGLPMVLVVASRRKLVGNLDELLGLNPRSFESSSETALINEFEGSEIHLILV
jgi:L-lactate utilization protein LutC